MHGGGIIAAVAIGAVLLLVGVWAFGTYAPELRRLPYVWERLTTPRADNPQAAYDGFYEALGGKSWENALKYITRENRERYRELLRDPETRRRQLADKGVLQELRTADCDKSEICRREAIYTYEYEVKEGFWEEVMGKRFFVPAGKQTLEMSFIELPSGRWQISEL